MACACIRDVNEALAANHNAILVTTLFGEQKALVGTEKLDSKKRGKPPPMMASHCPFCGTKYGAADAAEGAPLAPAELGPGNAP